MAWMIVCDSSCEIRELEHPSAGVQFALVPFKIRVGEREYVDLATLNVPQMLQAMTDYNGASTTACPSPEEWAEYFLQADNCIALTISSNLSGSYNAAVAARTMVLEEHPEKKIFILDTLSCSGALAGAAELANKLIGEDQTFEDICFALEKFAESTHILFSLASFDNLAKNGRVSKVVGFIAGRLNMRVLGRRTSDGKIDFYFKTRGETRVLAKILEQMDEDNYDGVHPVLISECGNQTAARLLEHGILAKWPEAPVRIVPCSACAASMPRTRVLSSPTDFCNFTNNTPHSRFGCAGKVFILINKKDYSLFALRFIRSSRAAFCLSHLASASGVAGSVHRAKLQCRPSRRLSLNRRYHAPQ